MVAAVTHRLRRVRRPRLRARAWTAIAVLLALAATGGWLWLRDSSLVAVEEVHVSGVSGRERAEVEQALERAAREMTTLHVDEERLHDAVARYPQVEDVRVEAHPLHRMSISVVERRPVAALEVGEALTPVAADGTLLGGHVSADGLPAIPTTALPGGGRLTGGRAAAVLAVVAAAPAATRGYLESVAVGDEGIEAQLRNGPLVLLGDADRAYAKWIAMGRVLGDTGSNGASYIDVRLPERPVAGGFDTGVVPSTGA